LNSKFTPISYLKGALMLLKSKKLSLTAVLALLGATLVAPPAWAATVDCSTGGSFTITDNVVTGDTNCAGEAVIPASVTSIDGSAFLGSTSLTKLTFSAGSALTSIGSNAFQDTSLASITIPNSVTSIGSYAFARVGALETVTFASDSTLDSIGVAAFYSTALTSITIPNSVTSIGSNAFLAARALTSISLDGDAPSVGSGAFISVGSNPKAYIGFSATGFGTATTWNGLTIVRALEIKSVACTGGGTFTTTGNVVTGNTGCRGGALVPNGVTSIGSYAFNNAYYLSGLTIPNSVTSIAERAFNNANSLTSITIPNSVTSIGSDAFSGTTALKTVAFGSESKLTSIGPRSFHSATALTSITIPNSVTSIGNSAFDGARALTAITIPNSVTSIGSYAFNNASALTQITIPNSVTSIAERAFNNATALESITFAGNAPTIGSGVFNNAGADLVVKVNYAATGFGEGTTWKVLTILRAVDCGTSGTFTITDNVVTGNTDCAGAAVIPNSVTSIGEEAFRNAFALTSITIPNSVTAVRTCAFCNASALETVTFAAGSALASIGNYAFTFATSLESISIPNGVTSIGVGAFESATSLTSVTFAGNAPSVYSYGFNLVGADAVANIGTAATGFGEGTTWNGLTIVRAGDTTLPTLTPVTGETNAGATLVIKGTNMDRITEVKIGGTVAPITARTTTSVTVTVPAGLAVGDYTISLTTDDATLLAGGVAQVVAGEVKAATNQKVNAGSFNTYVAVYAKGYKGQTLVWKIAGKWFSTVLTEDYQVFQRKTIAVGLEVKVDLFIDGERLLAKTVLTR
jgi:hypothetical protein